MGKTEDESKQKPAGTTSSDNLAQYLGLLTLLKDAEALNNDVGSMSGLEKLPEKARKEILRYLLLADRVKKPIDLLGIHHYAFQLAILRVNRRLSAEANAILYGENMMIKVSFHGQPAGSESMVNHEVAFFERGDISKFDKHVVSIDIEAGEFCWVKGKENHFLLLKQDVPKFSRYLRIMDLANTMCYHFKFDVLSTYSGEALSVSDQKAILEPFKSNTGNITVQTVSMSGNADNTVASELSEVMTQNAQWTRAAAWELFDIAASMKKIGDELWRKGLTLTASTKWTDAISWLTQCITAVKIRTEIEGRADLAGYRMVQACHLDLALFALSNRGEFSLSGTRDFKGALELCRAEDIKEIGEQNPDQPEVNAVFALPFTHYERRAWYFRGIAELGLDHPNKAAKNFAKTNKLNPQNAKYRAGYEVSRGWASASLTERRDRLQGLLDALPEPFPLESWKSYSTVEVKSEQYCLRKLGFKGQFPLNDKIKPGIAVGLTKDGGGLRVCTLGYVKYTWMERHLQDMRSQSAAHPGHIIWVGFVLVEVKKKWYYPCEPVIKKLNNLHWAGWNVVRYGEARQNYCLDVIYTLNRIFCIKTPQLL